METKFNPQIFESLCRMNIPDSHLFTLLVPNKCRSAACGITRKWVKEHYGLTFSQIKSLIREGSLHG